MAPRSWPLVVIGLWSASAAGLQPLLARPRHAAVRLTPRPRFEPAVVLATGSSSSGSGSSGGGRGGSRLLALVRRLRPDPDRMPRWLCAVAVRLRPFLPFLMMIFVISASVLRRSATATPRVRPLELTYATFMQIVGSKSGSITDVRIALTRYSFFLDGKPAFTRPPRAPADVVWFLHKSGIDFRAAPTSGAAALLPLIFPCIWLLAVYSLMRKQMNGATGSVGKKASSLRLSSEDLSFDDVAGLDTAKQEVQEVVSMLKQPQRYAAAGARLPSGVLMVGPPGTGKTLLARVMAAQAGVPFFYCSGSDFVELFVGRGAARMRALFKEAAAAAPCLIFVDELDTLGKQRSMRLSGANGATSPATCRSNLGREQDPLLSLCSLLSLTGPSFEPHDEKMKSSRPSTRCSRAWTASRLRTTASW